MHAINKSLLHLTGRASLEQTASFLNFPWRTCMKIATPLVHIPRGHILIDKRNATYKFKSMYYECLYMG